LFSEGIAAKTREKNKMKNFWAEIFICLVIGAMMMSIFAWAIAGK